MPRKLQAEKENRDAVLPPLRVSPDERAQIKAKALRAGLSVSEYQRRACLNLSVVTRQTRADAAALVRQLAGIGNNLNQLTRKVHIHDEVDHAHLQALLAALETAIEGLIDDR